MFLGLFWIMWASNGQRYSWHRIYLSTVNIRAIVPVISGCLSCYKLLITTFQWLIKSYDWGKIWLVWFFELSFFSCFYAQSSVSSYLFIHVSSSFSSVCVVVPDHFQLANVFACIDLLVPQFSCCELNWSARLISFLSTLFNLQLQL